MIDLLVIADDLTGANDTGVQFARRGLPTVVCVDSAHALASFPAEARVCVVDTESRHVPAGIAAERVGKLVRQSRGRGVTSFYKKTDSALRGNIGAELESLVNEAGIDQLPFIPAFPKAGRTTRGGLHYVDGVPLNETAFGRDPREPIDTADVRAILSRQTSLPIALVNLDDSRTLDALTSPGRGIVVFDCQSQTDLERIAGVLGQAGLMRCAAGPAAFAEQIARGLMPVARPPRVGPLRGPLLIVNGSLHEVAMRQLRAGLADGIIAVRVAPAALSASRGEEIERAAAGLNAGRDVLLYTAASSAEQAAYVAQIREPSAGDVCRHVAETIGAIAAGVVSLCSQVGTLAVFGGDTAIAVLQAIGRTTMRPQQELFPGIVASQLDLPGRRVGLITKSGAFGPEDLIPRLRRTCAG